MAKIEFSRQKQTFVVVASEGTASPGEVGNCVLSADVDAQFAVLRDVDIGDEIVVVTRAAETIRYRVRSIRVVRATDTSILQDFGDRRITLLSGYSAAEPNLRYAVVATARTTSS